MQEERRGAGIRLGEKGHTRLDSVIKAVGRHHAVHAVGRAEDHIGHGDASRHGRWLAGGAHEVHFFSIMGVLLVWRAA